MNPGDSVPSGASPWIVLWSSLGLATVWALVPMASCAPIEQIPVGDLTAQGGAGAGPECADAGDLCAADGDCCSRVCDGASGRCALIVTACRPEGEVCVTPLDCCGFACVEGACLAACVSDAGTCQTGAECCSGTCTGGVCSPLSDRCLTAGNACATSAECCSGLCDGAGRCSLASSYCVQPSDVCRSAADCCTGVCELPAEGSLGVCGTTPAGASNCAAGVSGLLCTDCNECCSRLCAPYGDSGVTICTPPSGCRVTGELCENDADCCGGDAESGLVGAGNAGCDKEAGAEIGVCRNAMGCSPQGNVCHLQDYACTVSAASNRCCDGSTAGTCLLDSAGIPRCGLEDAACGQAGAHCASSADCCGGTPCTPDAVGTLRCRGPDCAEDGEACTAAGDCCAGLSCARAAGSLAGQCYLAE